MVISTSRLQGTDPILVLKLSSDYGYRLDVLGGFRYLEFADDLRIAEGIFACNADRGLAQNQRLRIAGGTG